MELYGVSAGYISEIDEVISEQMHSALYHWSKMKNVFITLTEEEAFFYKPEAPLEVKAFVVLTVRHFSKDDPDSEESSSNMYQRMIISDFVKNNPELSGFEMKDFADDGYSGTNLDRPGIQEIFRLVKPANKKSIVK